MSSSVFYGVPDLILPYPFRDIDEKLWHLLAEAVGAANLSGELHWGSQWVQVSPASARYVFEGDPYITSVITAYQDESGTACIISLEWNPPSAIFEWPTEEARAMRARTKELLLAAAESIKETTPLPTPEQRTANEILKSYYRKRARNPKLKLSTYLKSIGEESREGYIRKAKVAYDKQHRHVHKG